MRGFAEALVFTGLAAAVHAAVIVGWSGGRGLPEGAGAGGDALMSVAAASGSLVETVAGWTRPPAASDEILPLSPVVPSRTPAVPARVAESGPMAEAPASPSHVSLEARPSPVASVPPPVGKPLPLRPPPRPTASTVDRAGQSAEGAGKDGARGASGIAEHVARETAAAPGLMARWGGQIRARIEARKSAPQGAWPEGSATVRITVDRDGRLTAAGIVASSGDARLDRAALDAVKRAGRLPAAPDRLGLDKATFDLPVSFRR